RFTDIERAEELRAAKIKLEAWRSSDRVAKKAAYAAAKLGGRTNVNRQVAYIKPFGAGTNFWYETKVLTSNASSGELTPGEENEASLVGAVVAAIVAATDGFASTTAPTGANTVIKVAKKIQFARVKVIIPGTATPRTRTSRFTGNIYTQKESKSVSCPFGMKTGSVTEAEAKVTIRNAILQLLPAARVIFYPQGFVG
ncbi:hypothetical protein, partial [Chroococcidiopsis sp.]|uniref:hypothetical protein n=1 Tax=Chroococcidiopsis sp. TaxID=3088168 RepID=UPI003F2D4E30